MDFFGTTPDEMRQWAKDQGLPAFRGQQVFEAIHKNGARSFQEISVLPEALRQTLDGQHSLVLGTEVARQESRDHTVKSLLQLKDGLKVECVSIPTAERHTVCVSSQVGCAVGCTFCASGKYGVKRDLTAGEIVYQILHHHQHRPVTNVVFMGSGEPLFNYDNVIKAIHILGQERGLGMGRRRITVSTSGVPDKIVQLGHDEPQVTLALSLHAPDDDTRSRLVPLNRRWPVMVLLEALDTYSKLVNRRMTFEYVCLLDANMTPNHAGNLGAVARQFGAHINLIPFNTVDETVHKRPTYDQVVEFGERVAAAGGVYTIRGQRGNDIDAACGQLANRSRDPNQPTG